ncbi:MAG TPA: bifunctional helix-turn-helix transcriptional regulator/GNAT family N-acetyltransferase [Xanthobacteraceae bacterium]|nr:bifunctional helix-turn-helix transcriptional regulator/GNAT family N-acetyltransferase [Xanthobacteraceae bacterium]
MPKVSRARIDEVRRFNRAYTRRLGVLDEGFLDTQFSLTEARVLHELSEGEKTASEIMGLLSLDAGYLSRMLDRFAKAGLISRTSSAADRRSLLVSLTKAGRAAYTPLEARSRASVSAMIGDMPASAQDQLIGAMRLVSCLTERKNNSAKIALRSHRPGDMGWITMRHGALYAEEYGYGPQFEALVAEICAQFLQRYDPDYERCWIAEVDGVPAGSVCLVRAERNIAKLRLMFLEPWARGQGVAQRLVEASTAFAKKCGYEKILLWTQRELIAARKLYARNGYQLVAEKPHADFGKKLIGETWELKL